MADGPTLSLFLASTSKTRRELLTAAGIEYQSVAPQVDEDVIRQTLTADETDVEPGDIAEVLARAKAEDVSTRFPGTLVIGADQVLACQDEIFSKADTIDEARDALLKLRGRTHQLHSAVALAQDGETVWAMVDTAHLTMRDFSMKALGSYMARAGDEVLDSVGCYKLEGPAIQLFERIEGDYFTILGLPMLPLIAELRSRGQVIA